MDAGDPQGDHPQQGGNAWVPPHQGQEERWVMAPGSMPTGTKPAAPAAVLWSSLQGGAPSPGLVGTLTILPKQRCIST